MINFSQRLPPAFAFLLLGSLAACGEANSHLANESPATRLEIDFAEQPTYLPKNFIAFTFDDGPDREHTAQVLNVLKDKAVRSTFFINIQNWSDVPTEKPMQNLIRRLVAEGHELGNHTARHQHLGLLTPEEIENEITDVERLTQRILGPGAAPLTLLRAPFGEPYLQLDPSAPSDDYRKVAPIVARHAVHIGWAIDAFDYECPGGDEDCVYNNVISQIDAGRYGIILLHGTYAATAGALPRLIDELRARGFVLGTVEDAVKSRFGADSRQLLRM